MIRPDLLGIILGTGSVIAIWWFVSKLFPQQRFLKAISALFLTISPWHLTIINYSWEISLSILVALLSGVVLIKIVKDKRWLVISISLLIIITSQLYKHFELGFSNTQVPVWLTDQQRREHGQSYNNWETKVFHNKAINYSLSFLEHYSDHFSGDFLFFSEKTLMYLFDILFLLIGFYAMIRKFEWSSWGVILLWLILSPINSTLTFNPPDSLRSALMVIPLVIISSFGALTLFNVIHRWMKRCKIKI